MAWEGSSSAGAELLSFLIADIRGYTSFTQSRGDEVAAELAGKFARMAREGIEAHGGRLLELRGDEALAVFGSARASLRAAVALQEVFGDETRLEPRLPLTVGMGLDAGEVVPVEGGYRGGALNLAARLCSLAKAGEALASEGVTHLAGAVEGVTVTDWGIAEVKGLAEPVRAFAVTSSDGTGPVPEFVSLSVVPSMLDSAVPMIGRDGELRQLSWAWRTARRGRGQVAVVRGPSGIGKTRLLSAVADVAVRGGGAARFFSLAAADPDLDGLRKTLAEDRPVLVAVDDVDAEAEAVADVLAESGSLDGRPVLVVMALDEEHASDEDLRAVRGLSAGIDLVLRPLDPESVRAVAALYLDSADAVSEVPAGLLESTGGVPRRLHQTVASWAEDRATRQLGMLASHAAGSRSEIAVVESQLATKVTNLQQVRERARLYGLGPGRRGPAPEGSPYKGLDSFGPEDAETFFGRERLVADLVARVAGGGVVGVVGPSGSGKSSLVRAGLIPAVAAGVLPDSDRWVTVVVRPGEHPVRALDVALLPELPHQVAARLTGTEPLLVQLAHSDDTQVQDSPHVLVVVDQAEELFTVCTDEAERAVFVDGLVAAAADPGGRIDVVLTVRADYYGRFAGDQRLASAIAANQVLVGPMTAEEYRRAITRPAQRHGVTVEPELVDALVDEVTGQPGALPLLSTALLELWEARTDRSMTLASYQATGGLHAAVARLAESVYTSLDLDQQQAARRMFLRLTGPGAGDTVVKRRVRLSDLATDEESSALVDLLARRRLLTIDDGAVEVAHEALLREWPRFTTWLEEDREGIRLRAHLADAAANWEAVDRDEGELYRGARLSATLDWTTAHAQDLSPVEQEFVTASSTEHQRATAHQHRQNRRLRGLLAGAAVFLVLALTAGVLAVRQANRADENAA
ncbi:MAG: AAA family ATPase, partial [Actinomycetota bacterium]